MSNTILENLKYNSDEGTLKFKDVRYMLIRPETIIEIQKAVEGEIGEKSDELIFNGGFTGGLLSAEKYKNVFDYSDQEILDFMTKMGGEIGWGKFCVKTFDPTKKHFVIEIQNSAFAAGYGKSEEPVCDMIRGVFAGVGKIIFASEIDAVEVKCLSKGDLTCEIVISSKL